MRPAGHAATRTRTGAARQYQETDAHVHAATTIGYALQLAAVDLRGRGHSEVSRPSWRR